VKRIKWFLNNIEAIVCVTLIAVMMILLFCQIIFRELGLPLAWTEELSMFCLNWLCYFGASLAIVYRRHMRVDIVVSYLPKRTQQILDIIANIIFIIFAVVVIKQNYILMARYLRGKQLAAATRIPKWIAYAGVPTAFGLMIIRLVQDTVKRVLEMLSSNNSKAVNAKVEKGEAE